jgi:hypothetical protein
MITLSNIEYAGAHKKSLLVSFEYLGNWVEYEIQSNPIMTNSEGLTKLVRYNWVAFCIK